MRYRYVASLSFAVAALCATARSAEAQCLPGWTLFAGTGNCYTLNGGSLPWATQQAAAAALGAHLVTIGSAAENEFVRSTYAAPAGTVWIGFNDMLSEGSFVWVTGEPVVYTNWNGGEPNNSGNEDAVQMYSFGAWNDLNENGGLPAVYELEAVTAVPEPATLALLAGGLLGVAAVARRRRA